MVRSENPPPPVAPMLHEHPEKSSLKWEGGNVLREEEAFTTMAIILASQLFSILTVVAVTVLTKTLTFVPVSGQSIQLSSSATEIVKGSNIFDLDLIIQALDAEGNLDNDFRHTITIRTLQLFQDGSPSAEESTGSFFLRTEDTRPLIDFLNQENLDESIEKAQNITASIDNPPSGFSTNSIIIHVFPGPLNHIEVEYNVTSAIVGKNIRGVARAFDDSGNVLNAGPNSYTSLLPMTVASPAEAPSFLSFENGFASFLITSTVASSTKIEVETPSGVTIEGEDTTLYFFEGPTARFLLSREEGNFQQGDRVSITVTASDTFGNIVTSESRSIALAANSSIKGLGPLSFENGTATVSIRSNVTQIVEISLNPNEQNVEEVEMDARIIIVFAVVCNGVTGFQDEQNQIFCKPVREECEPGTKQSASPTPTSDRICQPCDGITEFQNEANQTACRLVMGPCQPGSFQSNPPSPSTDRKCTACDGVTEYQDEIGQMSCKAVDHCADGEKIAMQPTPTSNRKCTPCPAGFADKDRNSSTPCQPCSSKIVMKAEFGNAITGTLFFEFSAFTNDTVINATVLLNEPATSLQVFTLPAVRDACISQLFDPFDKGVNECSSANPSQCAQGDISGRLDINFTQLGLNFTFADIASGLTFLGENSLEGRPLAFLDSDGNVLDCAVISLVYGMTYQSQEGQTICLPVQRCSAGEFESAAPSRSNDRSCSLCDGTVLHQPRENQRFCLPVFECPIGYLEDDPPSPSTDRSCKIITCPGLSPPTNGFITPTCDGLQDFGTACNATCNESDGFELRGTASRICTEHGEFSGTPATCECPDTKFFDPVGPECVDNCPSETFSVNRVCEECSPGCVAGYQYEAVNCTQETDRMCRTCRTCSIGKFASGGCVGNENTICTVFSECSEGYFELAPGNATADRLCSECALCPKHQFAETGCCESYNTVCRNLSVCLSNEFEAMQPEWTQGQYVTNRVCQRYRQCASGEFEEFPGNETQDRICSPCTRCQHGNFAIQSCSNTSDTICEPYTSCTPGESFMDEVPTAYSDRSCRPCMNFKLEDVTESLTQFASSKQFATPLMNMKFSLEMKPTTDMNSDTVCTSESPDIFVCDRGQSLVGEPPNAVCIDCNDCPEQQWAKQGPYCPDGFAIPVCANVTECKNNQYIFAESTTTTDRICRLCTECPPGTYKIGGCSGTDDTVCSPITECRDDQFEVIGAGSRWDRICNNCSVCNPNEYIFTRCTAKHDTICRKHQECSTQQRIIFEGTSVSDRQCHTCAGRRAGIVDDRSVCPDFALSLCFPTTTTTTSTLLITTSTTKTSTTSTTTSTSSSPSPRWTFITYLLNGDFDSISSQTSFEQELKNFLLSEFQLPDEVIDDLKISRGSIRVGFRVYDWETGMSHQELAEIIVGRLNNATILFNFQGQAYPNILGSASAVAEGNHSTGSTSSQPVGAIVGGVVGAACVITILVAFFILHRRHSRDRHSKYFSCFSKKGRSSPPQEIGIQEFEAHGEQITASSEFEYLAVDDQKNDEKRSQPKESTEIQNKPLASMQETTFVEESAMDDKHVDLSFANDVPEEVVVAADNVYSTQLSQENQKLREELERMQEMLLLKETAVMTKSKNLNDEVETVLASGLSQQNKQLRREIADLKLALNRHKRQSRLHDEALTNIKLKMEKAALDEELLAINQIVQVKTQASQQLKDKREEQRRQQEEATRAAERERIQREIEEMKNRLAQLEGTNDAEVGSQYF
eukprot:gene823-4103_t